MEPLRNPLRLRLGAQLRVIRRRAGLSGRLIGERIGVSQSKVSRIEAGELWPPIADITAWLEACYVDQAERDRVLALAEAIEHGQTTLRDMPGSLEVRAAEQADLDAAATTVCWWAPLVMPDVLHTPDYAHALAVAGNLSGQRDVDAAVAARTRRARALAAPGGPTYHLLIGEAALRWRPTGTSAGLLADVWAATLEAARLPRVTVQVVPAGTPTAVPPSGGFLLRHYPDGQTLAAVDTPAGQATYGDTAVFEVVWQAMLDAALPVDASAAFVAALSA